MHYAMRTIEVPFEVGKVITYQAQQLCKLVEAIEPHTNHKYGPDVDAEIDRVFDGGSTDLSGCRDALNLVVLERWGNAPGPEKEHICIIMEPGMSVELMYPEEKIFSRRGSFMFNGRKYYLFQF